MSGVAQEQRVSSGQLPHGRSESVASTAGERPPTSARFSAGEGWPRQVHHEESLLSFTGGTWMIVPIRLHMQSSHTRLHCEDTSIIGAPKGFLNDCICMQ